jgi:hypothetical protein
MVRVGEKMRSIEIKIYGNKLVKGERPTWVERFSLGDHDKLKISYRCLINWFGVVVENVNWVKEEGTFVEDLIKSDTHTIGNLYIPPEYEEKIQKIKDLMMMAKL